MFVLFALGVLFYFIFKHINKENEPILGVYRQDGLFSPFKFVFMYVLLKLRKMSHERNNIANVFYSSEMDLPTEGPQPLQDHPYAIDAVYFNATNSSGSALVCGVARRPNGICNSFLYFRVDNNELLLSPALPDSTLKQTSLEVNKFHVGGLKIDCIFPMREWRVQYNGKMKHQSDFKKVVDVNIDLSYKADFRAFKFETDSSTYSTAKDMSREIWSREYFEKLKESHQTHFEQFGTMSGKATIDDKIYDLKLDAMRDHSFGKYRDWRELHRYAIHMIMLENGDRISVLKISMPILFSDLTFGYICKHDTKKIHPVDECDFKLYQHGENFKPPVDYAFQFKAGGKVYTVQVEVKDDPVFFIGHEHEAMIFERLSDFKVNGINGWGCTEWQYRNFDKNII